jgi:cytoskeletal protein RodZ
VTGLSKALRAVAGIVVLVVLVVTVNSWLGQYKVDSKKQASAEASATATATVESTATTAVRGATLLVVSPVVMRAVPDAAGKAVKTAKKGERLFVIGVTGTNWLQVKDAKNKVGFIIKDEHVTKAK